MESNYDPFVGNWQLVPAESEFDHRRKPSQGTMQFVRDDDGYLMNVEGGSNGKAIREQRRRTGVAGGYCSFSNGAYSETPACALGHDFATFRDQSRRFQSELEGNEWHVEGQLSADVKIEETWRRLPW